MAKVKGPLLSLKAYGQVGKSIVHASWRGVDYVRQHVVPANPQSTEQTKTRNVFSMVQDLWKRMGSIARAPWTSYSQGKPVTDRNAITSFNVKALRGQATNDLFVGSPGSKGGVAPTAIALAGGGSSGEITATVTAPPTPTGWTLTAAQAFAIEEGDPTGNVPNPIAEAENTSPVEAGDTDVALSGLTSGTTYVVVGWLKWAKSDGTVAYGSSLGDTVAAT